MVATPVSLLVRLRQSADHEAWNRFVELYTPLLYGWAGRMGLGRDEAADLVQEVFTLLLSKMRDFTYDEKGRFRSWLRTVLVNKWREGKRRDRLPTVPVDQADLAQLAVDGHDDAFWEVDYRKYVARRALELMQSSFHPTTWQACWETAAVGRSAAEVAESLGISVGAVYVARSRVLRRLREELAGLLD